MGDPAERQQTDAFRPDSRAVRTSVLVMILLALGFITGFMLANGRGITPAELDMKIQAVLGQYSSSGSSPHSISLIDDDPAFGPVSAPVTIVEFGDFFCFPCVSFATETLPSLRMHYGDTIRFVYRDMPIQGGWDAAAAGNCAHRYDRFWEFHDVMFAHPAARTRETFVSFAADLGIESEAFRVCMDDPLIHEEITLDYLDGSAAGVMGTPKFFINDRQIPGAMPLSTFQLVIDAELEKLGITQPVSRVSSE